jgi:predicted transposase YbfD/YdcC
LREWTLDKEPEVAPKSHVRYFLSSLHPSETKLIPKAIREHWSVENLNHYKRDTSQWREDDHRHRRANIAQNLALTRNALLAIIPFTKKEPLSSCLETYNRRPATAIKLIFHSTPIE